MVEISVATTSIDNPTSARYAVEWAIDNNFNGVEFNAPDIWLSRQTPEDLKWLRAMASEHQLRYTHHFPPSALPGSHDPATREQDLADFIDEIRASGELGVEVVVVHPGRLHMPGPPEIERENVSESERAVAMSYMTDFMKEAAQEAKSAGVVIGLENMHYNPGWVVRAHTELAGVIDAVANPALGITFDTGHAWGSGGVDAGIEILGDRIAHVQVHDARGPEGAGNVRDQHMEVGTGVIQWDSVGELVKSNGFIVALETSGRLPDREDAVVRSRDLLRRLWT